MAQIQAQQFFGEYSEPRARGVLALFPARNRNGPDENRSAEKLPMWRQA